MPGCRVLHATSVLRSGDATAGGGLALAVRDLPEKAEQLTLGVGPAPLPIPLGGPYQGAQLLTVGKRVRGEKFAQGPVALHDQALAPAFQTMMAGRGLALSRLGPFQQRVYRVHVFPFQQIGDALPVPAAGARVADARGLIDRGPGRLAEPELLELGSGHAHQSLGQGLERLLVALELALARRGVCAARLVGLVRIL